MNTTNMEVPASAQPADTQTRKHEDVRLVVAIILGLVGLSLVAGLVSWGIGMYREVGFVGILQDWGICAACLVVFIVLMIGFGLEGWARAQGHAFGSSIRRDADD